MPVRLKVNFEGHVQGVGFRWTTQNIASGYAVGGWVKNMPGGSVQMLVEGDKKEVNAFLKELRERMGDFVRNETISKEPFTGEEQKFNIAY